jgi:hypothetical protein
MVIYYIFDTGALRMAKKLAVEKEQILWKDRKRFFGLPLSFTVYSASEERLTLKRGFFTTVIDELMIYRIMDIRMSRTLGQKIFGVGTVTLISTDKTQPKLDLKNIRHPDNIRRFFSQLVEKQRSARGISGSEFLGGGRPAHGHADHSHIMGNY